MVTSPKRQHGDLGHEAAEQDCKLTRTASSTVPHGNAQELEFVSQANAEKWKFVSQAYYKRFCKPLTPTLCLQALGIDVSLVRTMSSGPSADPAEAASILAPACVSEYMQMAPSNLAPELHKRLEERVAMMMISKAFIYKKHGVEVPDFFATVLKDMDKNNPSQVTQRIVKKMTPTFFDAACAGKFKLAAWYDLGCALLLADLLLGKTKPEVCRIMQSKRYASPDCFRRIIDELDQYGLGLTMGSEQAEPVRIGVVTDAGEEADDQMMISFLCHLSFTFNLRIDFFVGASIARIGAIEQCDEAAKCVTDALPHEQESVRVINVQEIHLFGDNTLDYLLVCSPVDSDEPEPLLQKMGCGTQTTIIMQGSDDRFNKIQSSDPFQVLCEQSFRPLGIHHASFIGMTSDQTKLVADADLVQWFISKGCLYAIKASVNWSLRSALCFCDPKKCPKFWATLIQHKTDPTQGGSNWNVLSGIAEIELGHPLVLQ
jgi:hypothetical protein